MNNIFDCKALDHAVTFLPTGKISPCCVIKNYGKDIELINDTARFADLKVSGVPDNCVNCVSAGPHSYKNSFDSYSKNIQMIDFRNSNLCNLKCRTCGPDYSSKWADELGIDNPITKTNIDDFIRQILTDSISKIYFAGGEPLLNLDHWKLLDQLIDLDLAKNISLQYSTNLTVLGYKDRTSFDYWRQFKNVTVFGSVDAVGLPFEYLRSGANWHTVSSNIDQLIAAQSSNLRVEITFVLSVLSVWFLKDVLEYAKTKKLRVNIIQLTDPHYLTLNVLPDQLVEHCVNVLQDCATVAPEHKFQLTNAINTARKNDDVGSFGQMISTVLLADKLRNENLFDLLPFKQYATKQIFKRQ